MKVETSTIYHYTDTNAFISILKNKQLWAGKPPIR